VTWFYIGSKCSHFHFSIVLVIHLLQQQCSKRQRLTIFQSQLVWLFLLNHHSSHLSDLRHILWIIIIIVLSLRTFRWRIVSSGVLLLFCLLEFVFRISLKSKSHLKWENCEVKNVVKLCCDRSDQSTCLTGVTCATLCEKMIWLLGKNIQEASLHFSFLCHDDLMCSAAHTLSCDSHEKILN